MSPDVAGCGLTCRLAAPTVARRGLASPSICHCWLPVWLGEFNWWLQRFSDVGGRCDVGWA
jgi:hypothetical protein